MYLVSFCCWDVQVPGFDLLYFVDLMSSAFSTDLYVACSYDILLYHCPRLGEGWDAANMFHPAKFCMYMPLLSQEPVIQWLSFVYVLQICFSFIFVHK